MPHWAYSGESGPSRWGQLDPSWALCSTGKNQSPIDIPQSIAPVLMSELSIEYQPSTLQLINNGHTIQVNYEPGSHIVQDGVRYQLVQFHFHAHSEHGISGRFSPLELHLVHRTDDGALSVVALLITEGVANQALEAVFANLPKESGEMLQVPGVFFDATELLPSDLTGFQYNGSLTTPPCTEGVRWHVLAAQLSASAAQIAAFTQLYANTARPVQPLDGRVIE